MLHRANLKQWQLEIGAYLLIKGCPYEIGQVINHKKLHANNSKKAEYITALTYDFGTNKIYKRTGKTIITPKKSIWLKL